MSDQDFVEETVVTAEKNCEDCQADMKKLQLIGVAVGIALGATAVFAVSAFLKK